MSTPVNYEVLDFVQGFFDRKLTKGVVVVNLDDLLSEITAEIENLNEELNRLRKNKATLEILKEYKQNQQELDITKNSIKNTRNEITALQIITKYIRQQQEKKKLIMMNINDLKTICLATEGLIRINNNKKMNTEDAIIHINKEQQKDGHWKIDWKILQCLQCIQPNLLINEEIIFKVAATQDISAVYIITLITITMSKQYIGDQLMNNGVENLAKAYLTANHKEGLQDEHIIKFFTMLGM